jgi:hypothetical protein
LQKQHKISSWGLDSWDPAAKAHMMAYDKQLKDFTTMYDEEATLEGYEEVLPHVNSLNSVYISGIK